MTDFTETMAANCPRCKSTQVVKIGTRNGYPRYLCRGCSKKFRSNGNAIGRRFSANQMAAAISMYYSGMSYKEVAEWMEKTYGMRKPSKATIREWVMTCTKHALYLARSNPIPTGGCWVIDDMQLDVGGQRYWIWNVVDETTRYLLCSHLTKERNAEAAEAVLRKARAAAAELPVEVRTARRHYYIPAVRKVFPRARHIESAGVRHLGNSKALSQREQDRVRQRTKALGRQGSGDSAQLYLDGWTLAFNLFGDPESMDMTPPGQAAGFDPPFKQWEDVVFWVGVISRRRRIPEGREAWGRQQPIRKRTNGRRRPTASTQAKLDVEG